MKKIIILLIFSGFSISCAKKESNIELATDINGQWNLISVSCLCDPINLDSGEHLWEFDISENKLHVVNNLEEDLHTILETGTYDILISENTIEIQTTEYNYYSQNQKLFLVDQQAADGPLIEFIRD